VFWELKTTGFNSKKTVSLIVWIEIIKWFGLWWRSSDVCFKYTNQNLKTSFRAYVKPICDYCVDLLQNHLQSTVTRRLSQRFRLHSSSLGRLLQTQDAMRYDVAFFHRHWHVVKASRRSVRDNACMHPTIFSSYDTGLLINVHTFSRVCAATLHGAVSGRMVVVNRMTSHSVRTVSSPRRPWYLKSDTVALLMTEWCPFSYCSSCIKSTIHCCSSFVVFHRLQRSLPHAPRRCALKQMARNVVICQKLWIIMPFPLHPPPNFLPPLSCLRILPKVND